MDNNEVKPKMESNDFGPLSDRELLVRIYERLTNHTNTFAQHIENDKVAFLEMNKKISGLERFRWSVLGGVAIVSAAITWISTYLRVHR
jgi:hypothetical protein